jgi:uncharacterized protein (DUF2267 family)
MEYQSFIALVEQRAGIPRDRAESVTCLTVNMLARRISKGEAEDLARRLPTELRPCAQHEGPVARFHLDEFLRRIETELGTDRAVAERVARAVLAALWTTVGPKEFADMRSQLPGDFVPLLEAAVAEAPPLPRADVPPFAGHISFDEFLRRVADRAGLDRAGARRATEAVLEVIAMRVTAGQVDDLEPYLPPDLHDALNSGIARSGGRALPMSIEAFLDAITQREGGGVSRERAAAHTRAVLSVLREAVGENEFLDTVAQLPADYEPLLPHPSATGRPAG